MELMEQAQRRAVETRGLEHQQAEGAGGVQHGAEKAPGRTYGSL